MINNKFNGTIPACLNELTACVQCNLYWKTSFLRLCYSETLPKVSSVKAHVLYYSAIEIFIVYLSTVAILSMKTAKICTQLRFW